MALIPVRGGSKSIPLKNIKSLAGRPLIWWSLRAANDCPEISRVIIATDSLEIENCVKEFAFQKVEIYRRDPQNATDSASTESVLLEAIDRLKLPASDILVLIQATNPFLESTHLSVALGQLQKEQADSLLSVVKTKRFFWDARGKALNYDFKNRPRRQDYAGLWMENGSFYVQKVGGILANKNRLGGKIICFEMPEVSGFEIDEPADWIICEELLRNSQRKHSTSIRVLLSDVDGVLTDAGMYYSETGDELKKFNTRDGMGLKRLQKNGIKIGIVTAENVQLNRRRAKKLGLDYDLHGIEDKLTAVEKLCAEAGFHLKDVAYIGDDVNDVELLNNVGWPACPKDACREVKNVPGIDVLSRAGGQGVVREFAELIIRLNRS